MNINDIVKENNNVLIDFYADWCWPCKQLTPILESLPDNIKIVKVNVEQEPELANKLWVTWIPAVFKYKNWELVDTIIWVKDREIYL